MEPIVEVTSETIDETHICCAIGTDAVNRSRAERKKEWMRCRFAHGHRFLKADVRGKVFIEFEPLASALVPVIGDGYHFIQCLWASGRYKGQGYGRALLEACEAATAGSAGLVAISTGRKRPFSVDRRFYLAMGFEVVDTAAPYFELLVKRGAPSASADASTPPPRFADAARAAAVPGASGFDFYYTDGCPFNHDYAHILADLARERGYRAEIHPIATREEALELPVAWGLFSLFYDGAFVSQEIYSEKKFAAWLDELEAQ